MIIKYVISYLLDMRLAIVAFKRENYEIQRRLGTWRGYIRSLYCRVRDTVVQVPFLLLFLLIKIERSKQGVYPKPICLLLLTTVAADEKSFYS